MSTIRTFAKTLKVDSLLPHQIRKMYNIFRDYYENTSFDNFQSDLLDKSHVFLVYNKKTKEISGFSTIKEFVFNRNNKTVRAYFSGDTIVEKKIWGNNKLGMEFTKFMVTQKLKRPQEPLYWNLISKGYKTYLLMANNFDKYYPRFDKETPKEIKDMIDACGKTLYPKQYREDVGVIRFSSKEKKDKLKENICEITENMREKYPKISFFERANPNWKEGDELVCIGEFQIKDFFRYISKGTKKQIQKIRPLRTFSLMESRERR